MKKILGLDLGTNSIGWALIEQDFETQNGNTLDMGSRIVPMTQDVLDTFGSGKPIETQTALRTKARSTRKLYEHHHLRRERLHRILNILGFLPKHYAEQIDFETHFGKFKNGIEPNLAYNNRNFIFKNSFKEMLNEFQNLNRKANKIPYDWTLYYLRKKALTEKIEKEELAWLILNFNTKRGYYQRGDDYDETNKNEYVQSFKIIDVKEGEKDKNNDKKRWYKITLENGWEYNATFFAEPQWKNQEKEFLIMEELDDNGKIKVTKDKKNEQKEKRKITPLPSFDEINLMNPEQQAKYFKKIKAKTEATIEQNGKTVGVYIYENLLSNPNQKIRGKLIRTIERKFYKDELIAILKKQIELSQGLFTDEKYNDCIRELYKNNINHQLVLSKRDFLHLFVYDIIFYQRPLKSQKSTINDCAFEYREYKNKDGISIKERIKAIPKSNLLYQEFRLWQWIYNLKIYDRNDTDVTAQFITDRVVLFDFLNNKKDIEQETLIKYFVGKKAKQKTKALDSEIAKYRWNYVEDKKYPMNETGVLIRTRLSKIQKLPKDFLTSKIGMQLWHMIYSITDKIEFEKALKTFANKHNLDEKSFVENFKNLPPFKSEYGSYSEKAIKKFLPLMRLGKYWKWEDIDDKTKARIEKIVVGNYDEEIKYKIQEKNINLKEKNDFQNLPLWLAQYIIYDRQQVEERWNSIKDLENYLQEFKQYSLRNPIVEQIVLETLRIVKEIWKKYGNIDEIHVELGREMKNTAEDRKKMTEQITQNEAENLRIKALIMELKNDSDIKNVRPYSLIQQEKLKIYENEVLNSEDKIPDDIQKISKTAQPTKSELERYKLWLEQKYKSPYTGRMISLSELFTDKYEIEHIIPKSRYYDDSLSNKVICESVINKEKDKMLAMEFINNKGGQIINGFKIFSASDYGQFIEEHYSKPKNKIKKKNLLLTEIPEQMINRQLNDTRYISKFISKILSNIVREAKNDDGVNSKNVIQCNGKITSKLKKDWGLDDIWNALILPRFERLNNLRNSDEFTVLNEQGHLIPRVPMEFSKGFQKKRIDHRHHALDAFIIACVTREHINLMNNEYANEDKIRYDLRNKLCHKKNSGDNYEWAFNKPFNHDKFTEDVKNHLEKVVPSFKQKLRIISKTVNYYEKIKNGKKEKEKQIKGEMLAIRKPLHKDIAFAKITRDKIDYAVVRKSLNKDFTEEYIENKMKDKEIKKILLDWLKINDNNSEISFSPKGIERMNKFEFLKNKRMPIYKVRVWERLGNKFQVSRNENKNPNKTKKYVEAEKGTNLYFAIYVDEKGNRSFETIQLNKAIEYLKMKEHAVPKINDRGCKLLFYLSPYDLVYVPAENEIVSKTNFNNLNKEQMKRLFIVNDFYNNEIYFRPYSFAKSIIPKEVDLYFNREKNKLQGSFAGKTANLEGRPIRESCLKLKVDRLGNIELENIE
jgi:CRISPR-associated endonuclease Csn1